MDNIGLIYTLDPERLMMNPNSKKWGLENMHFVTFVCRLLGPTASQDGPREPKKASNEHPKSCKGLKDIGSIVVPCFVSCWICFGTSLEAMSGALGQHVKSCANCDFLGIPRSSCCHRL